MYRAYTCFKTAVVGRIVAARFGLRNGARSLRHRASLWGDTSFISWSYLAAHAHLGSLRNTARSDSHSLFIDDTLDFRLWCAVGARSGAPVVTNSAEWGLWRCATEQRRVNTNIYIVNIASGWRREVYRLALTTSG